MKNLIKKIKVKHIIWIALIVFFIAVAIYLYFNKGGEPIIEEDLMHRADRVTRMGKEKYLIYGAIALVISLLMYTYYDYKRKKKDDDSGKDDSDEQNKD